MTLSTTSRELQFDGCLNVRDLGGLPTEDGRTTRFGVVVRGDSVERLTDEGRRQLRAYGVRSLLDLRLPSECGSRPAPEGVAVVRVPLLDEGDPARHGLWDTSDEPYRFYLDRYPTNFGRVFDALAAAEPAVFVHCNGGKDRTGLVSALVLRLAGVSTEDVADDFARSERCIADEIRAWIESAPDERERARRERTSGAAPETMRSVLRRLEARHGDVRAFLFAAGADPEALTALRRRLRGEAKR